MAKILKYRAVIVSLVLVFSVFNIGLPIVVASCPMMMRSASDMSCCMGDVPAGNASLTTHNDTSCCKTILAAERNTGEFVGKEVVDCLVRLESALIVLPAFVPSYTNFTSLSLRSSSPPVAVDIPVLTSSFLI